MIQIDIDKKPSINKALIIVAVLLAFIFLGSLLERGSSQKEAQETLPTGSAVISRGDVNGDGSINCNDLSIITDSILGRVQLTPAQKVRADFNIDGRADIRDTVALGSRYNLVCQQPRTTQAPISATTNYDTLKISLATAYINGVPTKAINISSTRTNTNDLLITGKAGATFYYTNKNDGIIRFVRTIPKNEVIAEINSGLQVAITPDLTDINVHIIATDLNETLTANFSVQRNSNLIQADGIIKSLGNTVSMEERTELMLGVYGRPVQSIGIMDEDYRTSYGIIVRNPRVHGSNDEVVLEIPSERAIPAAKRTVQLGDVDNNGSIGCEDLNFVGDILLGRKTTSDQNIRADVNKDGQVSILDYLEIRDSSRLVCQRIITGDVTGDNRIDCNDVNILMDFIHERLRPTSAHLARGDLDKNNGITINDVLLLTDMYPLGYCGIQGSTLSR